MSAAVGWFGDTLLTNGAIYPQHAAPKGWLRLRLLNGCNARSLNFATSDKRPLYVVASDGGLLPEPVKVSELPMLMGSASRCWWTSAMAKRLTGDPAGQPDGDGRCAV